MERKHTVAKVAEYPFDEYYLYKVFHNGEGRYYANLVPIDSKSQKKRITISYARYVMSVKERRILDRSETVDHIDNDRSNDSIDNLQILSDDENKKKYAEWYSHNIGYKKVLLKCPWCGRIFKKSLSGTHLIKGGVTTSCSRSCGTHFSALRIKYPNNIYVVTAICENVICEYIEKK